MKPNYWRLKQYNIIAPIFDKIVGQKYEVTPDDKLSLRRVGSHVTPWFFQGDSIEDGRKCDIWHEIYFNEYLFIPKGCLNCWKICAGAKQGLTTLKKFFEILEYQENHEELSKCGWETRQFVFGNYNSFWYAPFGYSLGEARELFDKKKKELESLSLHPILKRGCTEFEFFTRRQFGVGSSGWDELYRKFHWERLEKKLDDKVEYSPRYKDKNVIIDFREYQKAQIIEWAFDRGDETYLEFTDGKPLQVGVETYG